MAQMVERLPSKDEVLSSNSCSAKIKKKERKNVNSAWAGHFFLPILLCSVCYIASI
jgi:hypothetical protein